MTEIQCTHCKVFRNSEEFLNKRKNNITKPYFKLCEKCRARICLKAKTYEPTPRVVSYKRGPYAKRQGVEREKDVPSLEHYEIEHCIMFDPNDNKYYVKLLDYDAIVFFGENYHSDIMFETLGDAKAFWEHLKSMLESRTLTADFEN